MEPGDRGDYPKEYKPIPIIEEKQTKKVNFDLNDDGVVDKKVNFDLNDDGVVDKKDKTIAAKILATGRKAISKNKI